MKDTWTYSPQTQDMLREYMDKFPEVFETVGTTHADNFVISHFTKEKGYVCIVSAKLLKPWENGEEFNENSRQKHV